MVFKLEVDWSSIVAIRKKKIMWKVYFHYLHAIEFDGKKSIVGVLCQFQMNSIR